MKTPELKPCPFCGCPVGIETITHNGNRRTIRGAFVCLSCHASFRIVASYTIQNPTDALYEQWNKREADGLAIENNRLMARVAELEKQLAVVKASPFDGGMSQQEYFGVK